MCLLLAIDPDIIHVVLVSKVCRMYEQWGYDGLTKISEEVWAEL